MPVTVVLACEWRWAAWERGLHGATSALYASRHEPCKVGILYDTAAVFYTACHVQCLLASVPLSVTKRHASP